MAFKSTGAYVVVTTAGTPVLATSSQTDPTKRVACHTVFVQQHAENTGKLYLMTLYNPDGKITSAQLNKTTGVGVVATLPAPTLSSGVAIILPWVAYTIPYAPGGGNLADFYIDADVSGDKATVSVIVA